jgi:hypothetical protein
LQKKASWKQLQQFDIQQGGQQDAVAQAKLGRLQRQLNIDMAFLMVPDMAYMMISEGMIPQSFKEVMDHECKSEWLAAVDKEIGALQRHGMLWATSAITTGIHCNWDFFPFCC